MNVIVACDKFLNILKNELYHSMFCSSLNYFFHNYAVH